jgi:D-beta-D-heptose 7-phosphate kinase/D-beta-D-heptose 1-phosphate adenosyltransferase
MNDSALVVLGDVLLDVDVTGRADRLSPEAPVPVLSEATQRRRPGGAALAALLAARQAQPVVLIAPWADDDAARELARLLRDRVQVIGLPWSGATQVKTRLRAGSHPVARWDTGTVAGDIGTLPSGAREAISAAAAVLVADYGGGVGRHPQIRELLGRGRRHAPLVWDPHPRGADPVSGADLITPNEAEAAHAVPDVIGDGWAAVHRRAQTLAVRWQANAVAVTLGARGALLAAGDGTPLVVPAPRVHAVDSCGAGDAFAAAAAGAFAAGALPSEAVRAGVEWAARFVAAGGAAAVDVDAEDVGAPLERPPSQQLHDVLRRTRAAGGRVVATGGCFDLLHAGHVDTLQAARGLGDCLIVCLNSDASVRRLKGPGRPLQPAADRARLLAALRSVDAVAIFDEDTPAAALRTLRPDLWVKGGDYTGAVLPEADVLAQWGGAVVTLPYRAGRSTSDLVELVQRQ